MAIDGRLGPLTGLSPELDLLDDEGPAGPAPGKRTLTAHLAGRRDTTHAHEHLAFLTTPAAPVQREGAGGHLDDPFAVHVAAQRGVAGGGGPLPHLDAIQASFGHHDVRGVEAHVGGAAAGAAAEIGAHAYATGDDVAFAQAPDLRQAAHEAAHVVQQRGGVRLDGGVGRAGDPYEQHADAVADLVVRGESAEALLDTMAHRGSGGGPAVQRRDRDGDGIDDDVATPLPGVAITEAEPRAQLIDLLAHSTLPQLDATVDAISQSIVRRADAAVVYQVPIHGGPHKVGGGDLGAVRDEARRLARMSSDEVEMRQETAMGQALPDVEAGEAPLAPADPARIAAVSRNAALGLHRNVVRALWRMLLPDNRWPHDFFVRQLTDRLFEEGVPNGVLDPLSIESLRIGEQLVSEDGYNAGPIAGLSQEQITRLERAVGAPAGSISRVETPRPARRRGPARPPRVTVTVSRAFWVASAHDQIWALRNSGRAPTGRITDADLQRLGIAEAPAAAVEDAAAAAAEPAAADGAPGAVEGAPADATAPAEPAAPGTVAGADRARVESLRSQLDAIRNRPVPEAPPAAEPAEEPAGGRGGRGRRGARHTRAERDAARAAEAERRRVHQAGVERDATALIEETINPTMAGMTGADWSPAQMHRGSDTMTGWMRRVYDALGERIGILPDRGADAAARAELEREGVVTGDGTLRRAGFDRRLREGDREAEDRVEEVRAALRNYRALVTRLDGPLGAALGDVPAHPTEEQRDAALPRLQAALAAIGDHLGDGASEPLDPPPDLIRHSLTVRWPRPPSGAAEWSTVLSEARAWHGVFSGLLARGRRGGGSPTTIEQAERMTSGYEGGIVNVNRDAVYVDLHQSGVEVTNNVGNALTPGETRTRREGDSDGDLSMHLDPVFARNMFRFLQAMAGQGVTRMWTAGFLRSAMSPADTHPMGMACDVTGFTFSDGTIIHLRSGFPARAGHDRDDIHSGESDWFDYTDRMGSRTHAEVMMGIARAMTGYFDRIIGPGANAAHMGHFHVENSPNAEAMARRRGAHELHAVSAHSTHVPDFMRDTAERRDASWDDGVEPIPLTDPRAEAAAAAAGGDEGGDDVDG